MNIQLKNALGWTAFSYSSTKILQLLSNLILARLLSPEDFGLMLIVTTLLIAVDLLSDMGFRQSIVRHSDGASEHFLQTVWTLKSIRGACLCLILIAIAWPVSQLYSQPLLFPIICFASLSSLCSGFSSVHLMLAEREMQLKQVALIEIYSKLVSIILCIVVAYLTRSIWSLAVGGVLSFLTTLILSFYFLPHERRFYIDKNVVKELFSYGKWIFLSTVIFFFGSQGLKAIYGFFISTEMLGMLFIAFSLAALIDEAFKLFNSRLFFTQLASEMRKSESDYSHRFFLVRQLSSPLVVLIFCLVAFSAPLVVGILYDIRYENVVIFLQIICLSLAVSAVSSQYLLLLLVEGDSRLHFKFNLASSSVNIISTVVFYKIFGPIGVLYALFVSPVLIYVFALRLAVKRRLLTAWVDLFCFGLIATTSVCIFLR